MRTGNSYTLKITQKHGALFSPAKYKWTLYSPDGIIIKDWLAGWRTTARIWAWFTVHPDRRLQKKQEKRLRTNDSRDWTYYL